MCEALDKNTNVKTYRDLKVWQMAMDFGEEVYRLTRSFPDDERYGMTSQLRRAVVSVSSNIAEGYGRAHRAEYLHHLAIARGSLMEAETQLIYAVRLKYLDKEATLHAWDLSQQTGKMLNKLMQSLGSPPRRRLQP